MKGEKRTKNENKMIIIINMHFNFVVHFSKKKALKFCSIGYCSLENEYLFWI